MSRQYDFDVPYEISGFMLAVGWNQIATDSMFRRLPHHLQSKIALAHVRGESVTLTREDLDSIPDDVWVHIADKLGLSWS